MTLQQIVAARLNVRNVATYSTMRLHHPLHGQSTTPTEDKTQRPPRMVLALETPEPSRSLVSIEEPSLNGDLTFDGRKLRELRQITDDARRDHVGRGCLRDL